MMPDKTRTLKLESSEPMSLPQKPVSSRIDFLDVRRKFFELMTQHRSDNINYADDDRLVRIFHRQLFIVEQSEIASGVEVAQASSLPP